MVDGGAIFMQSRRTTDRGRTSGLEFLPRPQADDPRQEVCDSSLCDTVNIAREVASVADLQMRMQGIVTAWSAFLKLTPYAKDSGISD